MKGSRRGVAEYPGAGVAGGAGAEEPELPCEEEDAGKWKLLPEEEEEAGVGREAMPRGYW